MKKTRETELQTVGRRPFQVGCWSCLAGGWFPQACQENRLVRYYSGTQWHSLVGTSELALPLGSYDMGLLRMVDRTEQSLVT